MRDFHAVLIALNTDLQGWYPFQPRAISADGLTIVGTACRPGEGEAFLVRLPGLGDLNCGLAVNFFDIDPFLIALLDPTAYAAAFPDCDLLNADMNEDRMVDFFDADQFVGRLFGE